MAQNIYDNPDFFHGYSQLRRSVDGLAGAPEWPALQAQLPALTGLQVLDLGCGYGWFSRWAAEQGAARVLALDVSERMLEKARQDTNDSRIDYLRADLESATFEAGRFDLVYSSLALHYLADLPRLFRAIHAALRPGGRLVFSIEHPIYMASRAPGWVTDEQGQQFWRLDSYQAEGERVSNWLADGVVKYHRTLGTLLNQLMAAGFTLRHVQEWGPSDDQVQQLPALAEERERPMMLLVAAQA